MGHAIEVDEDVFDELKSLAEPFVDTPNSVLRRVFELDDDPETTTFASASLDAALPSKPTDRRGGANGASKRKKKRSKGTRAPVGSLLPESEYELPLLQALVERGGSAPSREVINAVGERIGDRLTDLDKEQLKSGGVRWESRVQFVRLRLIEQGFMVKESGRGTWAISEDGEKRVTAETEGKQ